MKFLDILKPEQNNEEQKPSSPVAQEKTTESTSTGDKFQRMRNRTKPSSETSSSQEMIIKTTDETSSVFVNNSQKVRICKPKSYSSVTNIGQAIKDRKIVILHLEELESAVATRILEFVYGICFAFDIEPENVDDKIIMIDPEHTKIHKR